MKTVKEIIETKEEHSHIIFCHPAIIGAGVGLLKNSNCKLSDVGIIVYRRALRPGETDVLQGIIPSEIKGVKVEVREGSFEKAINPSVSRIKKSGDIYQPDDSLEEDRFDEARTQKFDPMIGGIEAQAYSGLSAGTLGIVVRSTQNSQNYLLSNAHVFCNEYPQQNNKIAQPIPYELAADLTDWEAGNFKYNNACYGMDAAVAAPVSSRTAQLGMVYGFDECITESATPELGMPVKKSGLGSGITYGQVCVVSLKYLYSSDPVKGVDLYFQNQIIVKHKDGIFTKPGDSGSVIINTESNSAIALLWGRNTCGCGIASPIIPILRRFDCSIS